MIKLIFVVIVFFILLLIRLFQAGVGFVSVAVNKKGTFINFCMQYLKHTKMVYAHIYPYLSNLVDDILEYSKTNKFSLADETEFTERVLYELVILINQDELHLVRRPQVSPHIENAALLFALNFIKRYNVGQ